MKTIAVLLPVYNEKKNIEKFIGEVFKQEKELPGWKIEVLVVDSSSPDGTGELVQKLAGKNSKIHFLNVGRGLGVALVEGHRWSIEHLKPDVLAQLDADGQVEADVLVRLVEAIEEGYNLVLGSRFVQGGKNKLSASRRLFSSGSSWVCRLIMGPFDIKEFTNSARAFTPDLFNNINLSRLPWQEQSFIVQPAFLNEAILAGAKYQEVPLVFKSRAAGYSKNKVIPYIYDMVSYAIDARLHKWGLNIPFYYLCKRAKTFFKFGTVGFSGTVVDFAFYNIFISMVNLAPATAKGFSTEIAILNNFTLNNFWTFKNRKTTTKLWQKFIIFNVVSLGGLAIAVLIIKLLHTLYGDGTAQVGPSQVAFYNLYFFATVPPVMIWNFIVNHFVTWRNNSD